MLHRSLKARRAAPLGAGLLLLLALPAQAAEYDGNWQFSLSCSAFSGSPAFTDRFTAPIAGNAFNRGRSARNAQGVDESSRLSGRVEGTQMTALIERSRGNERWSLRFAGPAASDTRFDLTGGLFQGDRQVRTCQMVAEALTSAPGSLAATIPTRFAALREQLTAAQAALAEAQRGAEARADALQTELDLARFEGAAMRTEITQRDAAAIAAVAQRTALEGRLAAAEAAAAQAQAALGQAVANAVVEITQRDQAIAAAVAAAAALEARVATAEAAALRAQEALAQAGAAAQAAATTAEATAARLRTELATAQRELAEARAAQPAR